MLDETERKQLEIAFATAFDKWGQLYYEKLFDALNSGTKNEQDVVYKTAFLEQSFLEKRSLELGFYMRVLQESNSNPTIIAHRLNLIKGGIISVLNEEGLKIKDLLGKNHLEQNDSKNNDQKTSQNNYTRRNIQRILHDYYPESFFEHDQAEVKNHDKRFSVFSSVFASSELPETPMSDFTVKYLKQERDYVMSNPRVMTILKFNSVLRFAIPEFLEDLLKFKNECKKIFETLGKNDERTKFLRTQLEEFSDILRTFYSNIISILAMEWFRLRHTSGKESIFNYDVPLRYDSLDAKKASKLLNTLTNSEGLTSHMLVHSAYALLHYQIIDGAISLFKECKILEKSKLKQGTLSENIAVAYRDNKKYKLMLQHAKHALEEYKEAHDPYRVCVALKNIGEAEWMLGFKESALRYFADAESGSQELSDQTDRANVLINLAASCMRMRENKMEKSYHVKSLKMLPETETEKIIAIDKRLGELNRYC